MLRIIAILFLFLAAFSGCLSGKGAQKQNPAPATKEPFDPFAIDFGKVKVGTITTHSFILTNDSSKKLHIKDVNTSCGCAISEVKKKLLIPGESTSIDVKFNSKGYSGPIQQYIYVTTDSDTKPVLRFMIKAEVLKEKP